VIAELIGRSPEFLASLRLLARIAQFDVPVLIAGETGTGKELAARAIHYQSSRRDRPFIPLNCGGLPEALIENELFGHERGAFTDARTSASGIVALAEGGTLFLDELDTLSARAQVALLRFLQDQRYRPLGGGTDRQADVRIIGACNQNLEALVERGQFRSDLLFRLRVTSVELPPLRLRDGDANLLADHFLDVCAARFHAERKRLDAATATWVRQYHWPGNIRELENFIQREFLMCEGNLISCSHHQPASASVPTPAATPPASRNYNVAKAAAIEAFDRGFLIDLLERAGGNVARAAREAGKERRALRRLLQKYGIVPARFRR